MGIEILKEYEFFQEQIKETQLRVMHVHKGNVLLPLNFEIQWWIFERFMLLSSERQWQEQEHLTHEWGIGDRIWKDGKDLDSGQLESTSALITYVIQEKEMNPHLVEKSCPDWLWLQQKNLYCDTSMYVLWPSFFSSVVMTSDQDKLENVGPKHLITYTFDGNLRRK